MNAGSAGECVTHNDRIARINLESGPETVSSEISETNNKQDTGALEWRCVA